MQPRRPSPPDREPTVREVVAELVYERMRQRDTAARRAAEDTTTGLTWTLMPPWSAVTGRDREAWLRRAEDVIEVLVVMPAPVLDDLLAVRATHDVYGQRPA
jgi:hypothetical protein